MDDSIIELEYSEMGISRICLDGAEQWKTERGELFEGQTETASFGLPRELAANVVRNLAFGVHDEQRKE